MKWILLICVISFCLALTECKKKKKDPEDGRRTLSPEAQLYKELMKKYDFENQDRIIRPVLNTSETLNVNFGVALLKFLDYDEDKDIGTFMTWERYLWNDELLVWDPEEAAGINHIRIPIENIWKPDVILYNSFENPIVGEALAVVSSDGTVLYIPRVARKVLCSRDSDTIYCAMKFGSWTYDGFKLDVDFYDGLEEFDLSDYVLSNDYELVSNAAKKNEKKFPCCRETYPDLTFIMTFEKRTYWG